MNQHRQFQQRRRMNNNMGGNNMSNNPNMNIQGQGRFNPNNGAFSQQRLGNMNPNDKNQGGGGVMFNAPPQQQQVPGQPPLLGQPRQPNNMNMPNMGMMNRPRNLVNVSIHEEDQVNPSYNNNGNNDGGDNMGMGQHRGIKRSYNNNMNQNYNNNFNPDVNNQDMPPQNFQQQSSFNQQDQQKRQLLPNPNQQQPGMNQPNQYGQQPQQHGNMNQPQISHFLLPGQTPTSPTNLSPNTTLILKKVPIELNRIDQLRSHFSKFGQIVEILCGYENDPKASLIRFATNQQANAAFKSPQSVFNNRFIRVYWLLSYTKMQLQQQQNQTLPAQLNEPNDAEPQSKRLAKDRLSYEPQGSADAAAALRNKENKSVIKSTSSGSITKTIFNESDASTSAQETSELLKTTDSLSKEIEKLTTSAAAAGIGTPKPAEATVSPAAAMAKARQLQEDNQRKALLLKEELKKQARQLIEQQIKDQKVLMNKFEQAKTPEEKSQILELIKKLSETIEKEKEILKEKEGGAAKAAAAKVVPPPQHLLRLNNKRLNTTNFLKATGRGAGIHHHVHHQTGIPASMLHQPMVKPLKSSATASMNPFQYSKVDNRPRQLLFAGADASAEKDTVVTFVQSIGCHVEGVVDQEKGNEPEAGQFIISFATRRDAEVVSLLLDILFKFKAFRICIEINNSKFKSKLNFGRKFLVLR